MNIKYQDQSIHMKDVTVELAIRDFTHKVLHGDEEHKGWLLEAAECYLKGVPLPPPRGVVHQAKRRNDEHCTATVHNKHPKKET